VQGECNGKGKAKDFSFTLPSRSLPYQKVVQGECNGKGKAKDFSSHSRSKAFLFYEKKHKDSRSHYFGKLFVCKFASLTAFLTLKKLSNSGNKPSISLKLNLLK